MRIIKKQSRKKEEKGTKIEERINEKLIFIL